MRRLFALLSLVLLLVSPHLVSPVAAQCGTPVPTWTPTPTYQSIVLGTQSAHLIAYFPLNETSGTVADDLSGVSADGTYSGVTLAGDTFLNGDPAPSFDGINDDVNIYSAALASAFNPSEGTIHLWARVSAAGIWTDGLTHRIVNIETDGNNRIHISKPVTSNVLNGLYRAGGTSNEFVPSATSTDWTAIALTWSTSADHVEMYLDGGSVGTSSTLGSWSGALSSASTAIGSRTSNFYWSGNIAHVAIWDTPLSSSEITALYNVPSAPSPTPTIQPTCAGGTDTPTPTSTADLWTHWTAVPPETTGTPEPGQPFGFSYVATAGQVGIAVLLAAILFVLIAVSVIGFLRRRK